MSETLQKKIEDILKKHIKCYGPDILGFLPNVVSEIDSITTRICSHTNQHPDAGELLDVYYKERGFSLFIRENMEQPDFTGRIYTLTMTILREQLQQEKIMEVDINLLLSPKKSENRHLPDQQTFLFLEVAPDDEEFIEYYRIFKEDILSGKEIPESPDQLYQYCKQTTKKVFPWSMDQLIRFLKCNSSPYWKYVSPKLTLVIQNYCKDLRYRQNRFDINEKYINDICMETLVTLTEILSEKTLSFVSAKAFFAFIRRIALNKTYEERRKGWGITSYIKPKKNQDGNKHPCPFIDYIENSSSSKNYELLDQLAEDEEKRNKKKSKWFSTVNEWCSLPGNNRTVVDGVNDKLFRQAIEELEDDADLLTIRRAFDDPNDDDQTTICMEAILCSGDTPLYRALTKGIKDQEAIQIVRLFYNERLDYNDIVRSLTSVEPGEGELKRQSANLRKRAERLLLALEKRIRFMIGD